MISVIHQGDNRYEVYRDGDNMGCIAVSENPAHASNSYLNVGLTQYPPSDARELFDALQAQLGRPLQVMTYSDKRELCEFLNAGGFVCKRRCYEVEGTARDLLHPVSTQIPLQFSKSGEEAYHAACGLLFYHYQATHASVNPLTLEYSSFCARLPGEVVYQEGMAHIAFVEREEIAYVASREPGNADPFLETVLAEQLSKWGEVSFECDDCDPVAIRLLNFFPKPEVSFDTYIRAKEQLTLLFNRQDAAISVMKEVAAWGRAQGFRIWPDHWLTREELTTPEAQPENFCIGILGGEIACAFILQWSDTAYWPQAPKFEAAYLHKFCVRRKLAGMGMTKLVTEAIRAECRKRGIRYIRLDTALDEETVSKLYLDAGFTIVKVLEYSNGRSMALYELEV